MWLHTIVLPQPLLYLDIYVAILFFYFTPTGLFVDYDCLVSENGELTPKWFATKKIFQELLPNQVSKDLPAPPAPIKPHQYGEQL